MVFIMVASFLGCSIRLSLVQETLNASLEGL
jgi:hypothetical protein